MKKLLKTFLPICFLVVILATTLGGCLASSLGNSSSETHKHSLVEISREEPTCISAGEARKACDDAGCSRTERETIPRLGHSFDIFIVLVEPNDGQDGFGVYICSRCDAAARYVTPIPRK